MEQNVERLRKYLKNGGDVTPGQARTRFGIRNVNEAIRTMRNEGFAVYANKKVTANGKRITLVRLGTPTRAVVAAGYQALGLV